MKPFDRLTARGQARRLGAVARAAIALWPIEVARLRFLADATSVTWRVDAADGARYALRVARPGMTDAAYTAAEFAWLTDLAEQHPALEAPRPVPTRDGRLLVEVGAPGVPEPVQCALMTWVPGVTPGRASTAADHRRLGALSARLHRAAETFVPPAGFRVVRWDRVCYFPQDVEVLFTPEYSRWVPAARVPMLRAAWDRVDAMLSDMTTWPDQRILHGDLHPWNVHRVRTRLRPLDFADLIWGPPIQDIAISLYYLTSRDDYPLLRDAFVDGYTGVRPWPMGDDGIVRALHAARDLTFCNHIARALPEYRKTLPERYDRIEKWLNDSSESQK